MGRQCQGCRRQHPSFWPSLGLGRGSTGLHPLGHGVDFISQALPRMAGWQGAQGSAVHPRGRGPLDVPRHTTHIPGPGAGTVEDRPVPAPSPEVAPPVGPRPPPPSPRPGPGPSRTPPAPGRPKPLLPPLTSEGGHMTPRGPIACASLPQSPRQPARPPPAAHTRGRTRTHAPHSAPARGRDTPAPAVPGAAPAPGGLDPLCAPRSPTARAAVANPFAPACAPVARRKQPRKRPARTRPPPRAPVRPRGAPPAHAPPPSRRWGGAGPSRGPRRPGPTPAAIARAAPAPARPWM